MKKIYVKSEVMKEAVDYLNDDITFFGFLSHIKSFLKKLLINPLNADIDEYLKKQNLNRKEILTLLLDKGIIEKETKIDNINDKEKFTIKYSVPKKNFEKKIRRLYSFLFEKNEIKESILNEEGEGGCGCVDGSIAGATNANSSGQFIKPLNNKNGKTTIMRRKIYITNEQLNLLKETDTQNTGDYQYTVPFPFNNGNDITFDHKNIIAGGVPKNKK